MIKHEIFRDAWSSRDSEGAFAALSSTAAHTAIV